MSDYSQDDLNAFFKRKLENATPDENMWNIPPDFVFDNAISKVNAANSNHKALDKKWLLLLLISLLALSGLLLISHNRVNTLNETIMDMKSDIQLEQSKIQDLQSDFVIQKDAFAKELKNANERSNALELELRNSRQKFNNTSKRLALLNEGLDKNVSLSKEITNRPSRSIGIEENADQFLKNDFSGYNEKVSKELDLSNKVAKISAFAQLNSDKEITFLEINQRRMYEIAPNFTFINEDAEYVIDENIRYGIFFNQNASSLAMNNMPENCTLEHFDSNYSGLGISVQAEKAVSKKFDMQFGLGYNVINNRSNLEGLSIYDEANEVERQDGSMSYAFDLDIETPFGSVNTPTDFMVDNNADYDQDEIVQLTETKQQLQVLSLSVGPKYKFLENRQWELFTNASISYNRILHYENDMNTTLTMHDIEMLEFRATPPKINDINKNFLSAQIGLGLGFKLNPNMQFVMAANYGRSLNSLRVAKSSLDPKTYLAKWNSQIGINFNF